MTTAKQILDGIANPRLRALTAAQLARQMASRPDPVMASLRGLDRIGEERQGIRVAHGDPTKDQWSVPQTAPKPKRGSVRRLNKTEQRCLREYIQPRLDSGEFIAVHAQALKLDFEDGTRYEPDWLCHRTLDLRWYEYEAHCEPDKILSNRPVIIETKGGHRGKVAWSKAGIEKFRRAKLKWGHVYDFELVTLEGGGKWSVE